MNNKRIISLEYLRILSCIFVISIHVFMSYEYGEFGLKTLLSLLLHFIKCCVPVFLMITGFFMFKKDKTIKQQTKYLVKKIIAPTFFVLLFCCLFYGWLDGTTSFSQSVREISISKILDFFYKVLQVGDAPPNLFWLWYVFALILVYFYYPLLKYICVDKKEENIVRRVLLSICFISTVFIPSINIYFGLDLKFGIPNPLPIFYFFYILIGYEIFLLYQKKSKIFCPLLGVFLYLAGGLAGFSLNRFFSIGVTQYFMLNIAVTSVGIFVLFLSLQMKENKFILVVSRATFYVYLIHYPVTLAIEKTGIEALLIPKIGIFATCCVCIVTVFVTSTTLVVFYQFIIQKIKQKIRK